MGEYPYEECESCMWRHGDLMPMCDSCDWADQFEEAYDSDGDQEKLKSAYPTIKILEIA